ncbi:deoxynucleoside kinase [Gemmatimonadota bacterium]
MKEARYIAIEGPIGVGKTSLATLLGRRLGARLVLERPDENPFLDDFYKDAKRYAFKTQLFFTLSRYMQQQDFSQQDLFHDLVIADYLFAKDKIFAYLTLDDKELALYEKLVDLIEPEIVVPDLIIYLQATTEVLIERIHRRGRSFERRLSEDYLRSLNEAYNYYFFHYDASPLLVVNTSEIDFVHKQADLDDLIEEIKRPHSGTTFYGPGGTG